MDARNSGPDARLRGLGRLGGRGLGAGGGLGGRGPLAGVAERGVGLGDGDLGGLLGGAGSLQRLGERVCLSVAWAAWAAAVPSAAWRGPWSSGRRPIWICSARRASRGGAARSGDQGGEQALAVTSSTWPPW